MKNFYDELMKIEDLQKTFGISRGTVYNDIARHLLPAPVKFGFRSRFFREEIDQILQLHRLGRPTREVQSLVKKFNSRRNNAQAA